MVLHHLYGQQQLADCLAIVDAHDTLLIMDAGLLEVAGEALSALPCAVILLDDSKSNDATNSSFPLIDITGRIELISQHPHSMSWG